MAYFECTGGVSSENYALYIPQLDGYRGITTDSSYASFSVTFNVSKFSKMKIGSVYADGSCGFSHSGNTTYDIAENDTITLSGWHNSSGGGGSFGYSDIYFYY